MSAETTTTTDSTQISIVEGTVVSDTRLSVHQTAVSEIVGMIVAKYEEEGVRNFAIGKRAYEHAQWQMGNFPGYTGSDFDTLMRRVRDDVRMFVAIKPDSIQIADWVKAHVLRELVRSACGALADKLSCFEYIRLSGKALSFDKKAVEGSLVDGWLDMIDGVATDRSQENGRVTVEEFTARISENVKRLDALKTAADPKLAAAVKAAADLTAKADDVRKAKNSITKGVADAMSKGHVDPSSVMGIVEHVAKELNLPMPPAFGFDPATCTIADCDLLASTMFQSGKIVEMRHLLDVLGKMVKAADKQLAAAAAKHSKATTDSEPVGVKASREQRNAENRRNKAAASVAA